MPPKFLVSVKCPNPNCARCQKTRQVQQHAQEKLDSFTETDQPTWQTKTGRLGGSVADPQGFVTESQAPTVLMMKDLPSQEVVTQAHPDLADSLTKEGPVSRLLDEIHMAPSWLWIQNETANGGSSESGWAVLFLENQGRWNIDAWDHCPRLARLVQGLPNLLDDCLFGNAMISKLYPGTTIEPHCGASNVRHRLQMTLQAPGCPEMSGPSLWVGPNGTRVDWKQPGDFFVFDDSFVHSVDYPAADSADDLERNCRIVLIVDLWHPSLGLAERELLCQLYPPG